MTRYDWLHVGLLLIGLGVCIQVVQTATGPIPMHFGLNGAPNRFGPPEEIFLPWGIWAAVAGLLFFIGRHPEWHSSTMPGLTREQGVEYRRLAAKQLPLLSLLTGGLMLFVLLELASPVLVWAAGLGQWFWLVVLCYLGSLIWIITSITLEAKQTS